MEQIVVLGAGFGGLWAAISAQRKLKEIGREQDAKVTVVNRTPYHNIRVRNYEADISAVCVPLDEVLAPVGIEALIGDVCAVDMESKSVRAKTHDGSRTITYDGLVLALGSELIQPALPGLGEFGFNVDTYAAATALRDHLAALPSLERPGAATVVIIGAGLTGLEVATEMPGRLAALFPAAETRVVLVDRNSHVGSDMGQYARPFIVEALNEADVEVRLEASVSEIGENAVFLASGEMIPSCTAIWCAGMRPNPLCAALPVAHDDLGRIHVDEFMRVTGLRSVFAAGDVASTKVDSSHASVMSCQHARPMGRYAGHNVVAERFGYPMLPLAVDWYVTVLDLGKWGAVYTKGFDRQVVSTGASAKDTKRAINRQRIYPPRTRNPMEILAAAAPVVQRPPATAQTSRQRPSA